MHTVIALCKHAVLHSPLAWLNVMQVGGVKISPKGEFEDLCESEEAVCCTRIAQKVEAALTFHTLPAFEELVVSVLDGWLISTTSSNRNNPCFNSAAYSLPLYCVALGEPSTNSSTHIRNPHTRSTDLPFCLHAVRQGKPDLISVQEGHKYALLMP